MSNLSDFMPGPGLRNRIINGSGQVQQRANGTLAAASSYGSVDRMRAGVSGGTGVSGAIGVLAIGTANQIGYGAVACSWTTGQVNVDQRIEARNTVDLNNKTITVSCKVYHDFGAARNVAIALYRPTSTNDDFSALTTVFVADAGTSCASGSTTTISRTFALGASDASRGIQVSVQDVSAANTVTSKSFVIGELQLELGSVATPFEQRPYGMELALCQRYCFVPATVPQFSLAWVATAAAIQGQTMQFPVKMRTTPVVTGVTSYTIQGLTSSATGFGFGTAPDYYSLSSTAQNGLADGALRSCNPNQSPVFSAEL